MYFYLMDLYWLYSIFHYVGNFFDAYIKNFLIIVIIKNSNSINSIDSQMRCIKLKYNIQFVFNTLNFDFEFVFTDLIIIKYYMHLQRLFLLLICLLVTKIQTGADVSLLVTIKRQTNILVIHGITPSIMFPSIIYITGIYSIPIDSATCSYNISTDPITFIQSYKTSTNSILANII